MASNWLSELRENYFYVAFIIMESEENHGATGGKTNLILNSCGLDTSKILRALTVSIF